MIKTYQFKLNCVFHKNFNLHVCVSIRPTLTLPILRNGTICIGFDPRQIPSNAQISAGPISLAAEAQPKGHNTDLSSRTIGIDYGQGTATVSLAWPSVATIRTDMIIRN